MTPPPCELCGKPSTTGRGIRYISGPDSIHRRWLSFCERESFQRWCHDCTFLAEATNDWIEYSLGYQWRSYCDCVRISLINYMTHWGGSCYMPSWGNIGPGQHV